VWVWLIWFRDGATGILYEPWVSYSAGNFLIGQASVSLLNEKYDLWSHSHSLTDQDECQCLGVK
jgi:hypothetical protein